MRKFYWLTLVVLILLVVFGAGCAPTITPLPPGLIGEEAVAKEVEPTEGVVVEEKEVVEFPKSGEYVVDTGDPEFQVSEVFSEQNAVKFRTPLLKSQYQKQGLKSPDWQLSASYAWTDGKRWFLVAQDDYTVETTIPDEEEFRDGYLVFPKKGNGWYWVRVWGQDIKSHKWLWINQSSIHCRNDTNGNPGYEFLVHPSTGRYQTVPIAFNDTRK